MRCVLLGAVDTSLLTLEALVAHGFEVALVITLPVELAGRHSDFADLAAAAEPLGISVLRTADANAPEVVEAVRALAPDLLFVIGWSRLCSPAFIAAARRGALGYHPTLLPEMRGRSPLAWTILLGLERTGASVFWLDAGADTGPIACQRAFPIGTDTDLPTLKALHLAALSRLWDELLPRLRAGERPARAQDESRATFLARRRPEDGEIDWRAPAPEIARLVRALARPYPGAFTYHQGVKLMIWQAEPVELPGWHAQIGQIVALRDGCPVVLCGGGTMLALRDYARADGRIVAVGGQPRLGA